MAKSCFKAFIPHSTQQFMPNPQPPQSTQDKITEDPPPCSQFLDEDREGRPRQKRGGGSWNGSEQKAKTLVETEGPESDLLVAAVRPNSTRANSEWTNDSSQYTQKGPGSSAPSSPQWEKVRIVPTEGSQGPPIFDPPWRPYEPQPRSSVLEPAATSYMGAQGEKHP